MVNKKVLFLVGNGFVSYTRNYFEDENFQIEIFEKWRKTTKSIKAGKADDDLLSRYLDNTCAQLKNYCELLEDINLEESSITGETLLSQMEYFFKNRIDKEILVEEIFTELEETISKEITNKFHKAIDETKIGFLQYMNATVKFAFKVDNTFFAEQLYKIVASKYSVYTTNYDYIVESVFTEVYGSKRVDSNIDCKHLHGHFDRANELGSAKGQGNIICCSPKKKLTKIMENNKYKENKENFELFQNEIEKMEVVVLFGIGLTTDPHILDVINTLKNKKIIIIDYDRNQYFDTHLLNVNKSSSLRFKFIENNSIYFIDTKGPHFKGYEYMGNPFTPKDIIDSLDKIFTKIYSE